MSFLTAVPRIIQKDVMRLPAKVGKLGKYDVRIGESINEAGSFKLDHNIVNKKINGGMRSYCHSAVSLDVEDKMKINMFEAWSSHFSSVIKLIIGRVQETMTQYFIHKANMRSEHTTVDKFRGESLLDGNCKKHYMCFSVSGSVGMAGGIPKENTKYNIEPIEADEKLNLDIKNYCLEELKEIVQRKQFENIVETFRRSRLPQEVAERQMTKEEIDKMNYAMLCRVYELNIPGTLPKSMQDQEPPKYSFKRPMRPLSRPKPRREGERGRREAPPSRTTYHLMPGLPKSSRDPECNN